MRQCTKCKKSGKKHYKNSSSRDGLSSMCAECLSEKKRELRKTKSGKESTKKAREKYVKANRREISKRNTAWGKANYSKVRNTRLMRIFGIDCGWYEKKLKEQKNVCAICYGSEIAIGRGGTIKNLSVDHDHETGKIRGLLCSRCNNGLGNFRENPRFLNEAVKYLQNTKTAKNFFYWTAPKD